MGSSWIAGNDELGQGWAGVSKLAPEVFAAFDNLARELRRAIPADLLELCWARMAMLLGAPLELSSRSADRSSELASWPYSPAFSSRDRACLALAEQFVMDVTEVDEHHIGALLEHMTVPEAVAVVNGLWFGEAMLRLGLVLGVKPELETLGV